MQIKENIIIVSHTMLYGAPHALRDYLLKKPINFLLFISLPFFDQRIASCSLYKKGILVEEKRHARLKSLNILDYSIDALEVLWWVYKQKGKFSLYVGINPMNCIIGLFFRKIQKVEKVIFYAIDFTPKRFGNSLLNYLYHKLEIYCVMNADEVWNVSPRIAEGRETFLHVSQKDHVQKVVPIGVWSGKEKKMTFSRFKKHQIVFLGHLLEKQGVQVVLEAVPLIIKQISDFVFVIIGGGEYEKPLKNLSDELQISKYVEFKGWIKNKKGIDILLRESALAVATYKPEKDKLYNFTYYADPTKIKDYLANGLPVILTNVSYNAYEIVKRKCGVVVEYKKERISQVIIDLLNDQKKLKKYRKNAFLYAKEFDWNSVFSRVLE